MMAHSAGGRPTVLRDKATLLSFPKPAHRWILWHLTGNCNLECVYCYGSFQGGSYKASFNRENDVPTTAVLSAADDIAALGFEYVHLCGGEPFLRPDIWQVVERLDTLGVQPFMLTNGTLIPAGFEEGFSRGWLRNLSFSLDALDPSYNDYVRSRTKDVIANIETVAKLKLRHNLDTELGLYIVLSRLNIDLVPELLSWARSVGIGYVNMQAVYLPEDHPMRAQLSLTQEEAPAAMALLEQLREMRGAIRTSSDVLISLTNHLLGGARLAVDCCFSGDSFLFIDSSGYVYGCPARPLSENRDFGNIRERSLIGMLHDARALACTREDRICPFLSLDCLGMYEMVYMTD
jgi:MoaA/NifB/PqqE/SkfB family radical SAM enzyme